MHSLSPDSILFFLLLDKLIVNNRDSKDWSTKNSMIISKKYRAKFDIKEIVVGIENDSNFVQLEWKDKDNTNLQSSSS